VKGVCLCCIIPSQFAVHLEGATRVSAAPPSVFQISTSKILYTQKVANVTRQRRGDKSFGAIALTTWRVPD
jgi:hypothetical protein